jgi:LmbE family N-acetylglucosaminyl deacetylase
VADLRRTEQRAAAALVGVTDLTFLGYTDGELTVSLQLRRDLARAIRRTRPDVVISTSPQRVLDRFYFSHPDHLAAGEATLCAIYPDARNEHAHPSLADEGWQPWTVPQVWLVGHEHPNLYQDVTDTYPSKLAAILAHGSQHPPGRPPDALDAGIRAVLGAQAEVAGLASGRLAEAFRLVVTA